MIYFVTSNPGKVREAKAILEGVAEVEQKDVGYDEIRAETCEEVVREAISDVFARVKAPVFIEDAGLFIEGLGGFPGTYSAYVFRRLGCEGILRLLKGQEGRGAKFISSIAYQEPDSEPFVASGTVQGEISKEMRGQGGFGYDPVFVPQRYDQTFAELGDEKNRISHRWKALESLRGHLQEKS